MQVDDHVLIRFTDERVECVYISIREDFFYNPGREFLFSFNVTNPSDRFQGPNQVTLEVVENGKRCFLWY